MSKFVLSLLVILVVASPNEAADPVDKILQRCQEKFKETQALDVLYTLTEKDRTFHTSKVARGRFRILQTDDGKVYGSVLLVYDTKTEYCVLHDEHLYLVDYRFKTIRRWKMQTDELLEQITDLLYPHAILVAPKLAKKRYNIELSKKDKHYTYLDITLRNRPNKWFFRDFTRSRLVLTATTHPLIPKHAPRQMWFQGTTNGEDILIDIGSWKENEASGLSVDDFPIPVKKKGWEFLDLSPEEENDK